MGQQAALEYAKGMSHLSAVDANVEMVRMMGVKMVTGRIPRDVRSALNAAVKNGRLGHLKKDGLKPEVYFHPNSIFKAKELRNKSAFESIEAIKKVCC